MWNRIFGLMIAVALGAPSVSAANQSQVYREVGCDKVVEQLTKRYLQTNTVELTEKHARLSDVDVTSLEFLAAKDIGQGSYDMERELTFSMNARGHHNNDYVVLIQVKSEGDMLCEDEEILGVNWMSSILH